MSEIEDRKIIIRRWEEDGGEHLLVNECWKYIIKDLKDVVNNDEYRNDKGIKLVPMCTRPTSLGEYVKGYNLMGLEVNQERFRERYIPIVSRGKNIYKYEVPKRPRLGEWSDDCKIFKYFDSKYTYRCLCGEELKYLTFIFDKLTKRFYFIGRICIKRHFPEYEVKNMCKTPRCKYTEKIDGYCKRCYKKLMNDVAELTHRLCKKKMKTCLDRNVRKFVSIMSNVMKKMKRCSAGHLLSSKGKKSEQCKICFKDRLCPICNKRMRNYIGETEKLYPYCFDCGKNIREKYNDCSVCKKPKTAKPPYTKCWECFTKVSK